MKATGVKIAPLSLFVALKASLEQWRAAMLWLSVLVDETHDEYDYQVGEWVHYTDKAWDVPKEWMVAYRQNEGGTLLTAFVYVEQMFNELTTQRELARKGDVRKNHDNWKKDHPWEGRGYACSLAVLKAKYGNDCIPYNKALCLLWWAGEM